MCAPDTSPLDETVRRLRAEGRKRAVIGAWHVNIAAHHALFEHNDDRERRLAPKEAPRAAKRAKASA